MELEANRIDPVSFNSPDHLCPGGLSAKGVQCHWVYVYESLRYFLFGVGLMDRQAKMLI
jgi:hypothetical protein